MQPRVGMGIIVVKDGQVLFIQRRNAHGDGTWSIPGGHLEQFETLEQCAIREVLEETGVRVKNPVFVDITNDFYQTDQKHYITIFMRAEYESGEPTITEPDKCVNVGWRDITDLPSNLFLSLQNFIDKGNKLFSTHKHYKGKHYQVLGVARHSETKEPLVVYKGLYDDPELGKEPLFVRPKEMFDETIIIDGKEIQRFEEVN